MERKRLADVSEKIKLKKPWMLIIFESLKNIEWKPEISSKNFLNAKFNCI